MRKFEFIKPVLNGDINPSINYGKFTLNKLERGYGITLGNALRRIMLSSFPGIAVVGVKINNIEAPHLPIPNCEDSLIKLILNLKELVVKGEIAKNDIVKVTIEKQAGDLHAFDIKMPDGLEIINLDLKLLTVLKGKITFDIFLKKLEGYQTENEVKSYLKSLGNDVYPIDASFTPIKRCRYTVDKARVGDNTDYDLLTLEVWTDGSVTPQEAVAKAADVATESLSVLEALNKDISSQYYLYELEEQKVDKRLFKKIEDLDLSVRSYNCLKKESILTVGDLILKTEAELRRIDNMGTKSVAEIIDVLKSHGLELKPSADSLIPNNLENEKIAQPSELAEKKK